MADPRQQHSLPLPPDQQAYGQHQQYQQSQQSYAPHQPQQSYQQPSPSSRSRNDYAYDQQQTYDSYGDRDDSRGGHPLPPSPLPHLSPKEHRVQSQAGPSSSQQRSRPRSRGLSFRSDRSKGSAGETPADKDAKRLGTKADPTMAMNEAEPAAVAANAEHSIGSIRNIKHYDETGRLLEDPDLSNPTRPRLERPLETIRKFEEAIDGNYNNRRSVVGSDTNSVAQWNPSRRSSYFGGSGGGYPGRYNRESYYGGRPPTHPQYGHDGRQNGGMQGPFNGRPGPNRARYPRAASEPHMQQFRQKPPYGGPPGGPSGVYGQPQGQPSYETVASGSGSGITGESADYQTDPTSSDNSSIERRHSPPKRRGQAPQNDYGINFGQTDEYRPSQLGTSMQQNTYAGGNGTVLSTTHEEEPPLPPVPVNRRALSKQPSSRAPPPATRPEPEKRKSWFKRLSKNN